MPLSDIKIITPYRVVKESDFIDINLQKLQGHDIGKVVFDEYYKETEKRCSKNYFICKLLAVNEMNNYALTLDLGERIRIPVSVTLLVCDPFISHTECLLFKVENVIKNLITARNGPINTIIDVAYINKKRIRANGEGKFHTLDGTVLQPGMIVKVQPKNHAAKTALMMPDDIEFDGVLLENAKSIHFFQGSSRIDMISALIDVATPEEAKLFKEVAEDYL
jgi:hypothetical protein